MKKKVIGRTALGFPLGVFISYTITIIISLGWGGGYYAAVVPQLVEQTGSEINAVMMQFILSGILGMAFAGASCVWETEDWSILRQTATHFVILTGSMFPIAWFSWWMPHTPAGVLQYIGIFLGIYIVMYVVIMLYWRQRVKKMDERVQQVKKSR